MNAISLYKGILSNNNEMTKNTLNKVYSPIAADSSNLVQSNNHNPSNKGVSFKDIINNEIEKVNNRQIKADELTQGFISGQVEDLHTVLIATEEARLSLELAVQVRNKCIEAFKEINNMQL